jgi:two-component system response regulator TctD
VARHWTLAGTWPDVVMLDLTLPGLDGLQVLEQARAAGLTTPVLILTARGTVGDRIIGLNTGADDYLPKPFDLDELEARMRALARRQGATAKDQVLQHPAAIELWERLRLNGTAVQSTPVTACWT